MMAYESGTIRLMFMLVYLIVLHSSPVSASSSHHHYSHRSQNSSQQDSQHHHGNHYQRHHSAVYEMNHHEQPQQHQQSSSSRPKKSSPEQLPQEQKLALQILISDPANGKKTSGVLHKRHPNILIGKKRPYDVQIVSAGQPASGVESLASLDKYSTFEKHFYQLEPMQEEASPAKSDPPQEPQHSSAINPTTNDTRKHSAQTLHRVEVVRTQHRPPWYKQPVNSFGRSTTEEPRWKQQQGANYEARPDGRRFQVRITTIAPTITSTEFYQLISSAHSPMRLIPQALDYPLEGRRRTAGGSFGAEDQGVGLRALPGRTRIGAPASTTSSTTRGPERPERSALNRHVVRPPNVNDGHVVSPEITVSGGDPHDLSSDEIHVRGNLIKKATAANRLEAALNALRAPGSSERPVRYPLLNFTLAADKVPSTIHNDQRKVTIIRQSPKSTTTTTTTTTEPPMLEPDRNKIEGGDLPPQNLNISSSLDSMSPLDSLSSLSLPPNSIVRMIAKHKSKYDDNIRSPTLTVVDNDAIRLPPNATSVHNKLIVAIRPGRPRRYPSTTQFPVYNIVAGITPPPTNHSPTSQPPFHRPNSPEGSMWGLLKPEVPPTTQAPSSFGAQNIRFPAAAPSNFQSEHVAIAEKLNISVPDNSNFVGPNKVPNKIQIETEEQLVRPPDALITSDPTIVSRPHNSNLVVNQDGIMKLATTTRKPSRFSTTKRINIIATNTTVVHQFNHTYTTTPRPAPSKPSFLAYLANVFNAGVATSAVAVLSLIKTIFVAILVMFLPPIALTAAITQAVALG